MDVVALGELLIDFTPAGQSESGMRLFEQNPGGAPANVLCALSNFGLNTAFIGKIGQDVHGDFLRKVLQKKQIDVSGLICDPDVFTTLAFVELSQRGERSFSFARKPGADTCLRPEELNRQLLQECKLFHFGSLSLTHEPARSATLAAIRLAKEAGAIISYDPNYRMPLWHNSDDAMEQMRSVLPLVDVIKISDEETVLLTGASSPEDASQILLQNGIPCSVITLGKDGALVRTKAGAKHIAALECKAIDTTGAGDAFWGGFLYSLVQSRKLPQEISLQHAAEFAVFANAAATLCVQKRGAIPAMPMLKDVLELYSCGII